MGFFGKMFGKRNTSPLGADLPGMAALKPTSTRVEYDPNLIQFLLQDHAQLGAIYGRLGDMYRCGEYSEVRRLLAEFKSRLEAHVLTENVRFYNFLEQSIADDPTSLALMQGFRREMNEIVRQVLVFIHTYQHSEPTPQGMQGFMADYIAVRHLLERRLDSEEDDLYALYKPF